MEEVTVITEKDGTLAVLEGRHRYRWVCIAQHKRTKRDGTRTSVLTWEAPCIECDQCFYVTTGINFDNSHAFQLRRCLRHRQGPPADARRREKAARRRRRKAGLDEL